MNQNHFFADLPMGLPEDILRLKMHGDFEQAIRHIDARLQMDLPGPMANCLRAEREIMLRLPEEYPYTKEAALQLVQREIPGFSMQELDALLSEGRIDWILIKGEPRFLSSFFATLKKTDACIALRAGINPDPPKRELCLERVLRQLKSGGEAVCRLRIGEEAFLPGKRARVWLPVPAACRQQRDIKIIDSSPKIAFLAPEDAPQRTAYFEETLKENHPFTVEYEYESRALLPRPGANGQEGFEPKDLAEQPPHIRFTPYLCALCALLCQGKEGPMERARSFYDFITTRVQYAFVREYFGLTSIAESCAQNLRGDCGVQALLFITLCRCAGVPARWQSGLYAGPDHIGPHDWAQFYVQPFGWLPCDPSLGGGAYRAGNEPRRQLYFGGLDPYRMVANSAIYADFQPSSWGFRADPYDNQSGEVEIEGRGLRYGEYERTRRLICMEELF